MSLQPPRDPSEFEDLCCDLWRRIWDDPKAQRNGRPGQKQHGVDVFGQTKKGTEGLQCRTKDELTGSSLQLQEVEDIVTQAEGFKPPLAQLTVATTTPRDATLQEQVGALSASREKNRLFSVAVSFWEDIRLELGGHEDLLRKYYPWVFPGSATTPISTATLAEIRSYLEKFSEDCDSESDPWIELNLRHNEQIVHATEVLTSLRGLKDVAVLGSSGSGKSYLLKHLALQLAQQGSLPILAKARYYSGELIRLVSEAIAPFSTRAPEELLAGCQALKMSGILIIDGINEIEESQQERLIGQIRGMKLRAQDLCFVVTARKQISVPERMDAVVLHLLPPSEEQRRALCKAYHVGPNSASAWAEVLRTPLDFKLAGEITDRVSDQAISQYMFFHAYFEKKLAGFQDSAFKALSEMAARLTEQISWKLSRPEVLRIFWNEYREGGLLTMLLELEILTEALGQVAFWHERFQHFFQAETLLSTCKTGQALSTEISRPRNRDTVPFVLAALDDTSTIRACLAEVEASDVLLSGLRGELGPRVQALLERDVEHILSKAKKELDHFAMEAVFPEIGIRGGFRATAVELWPPYERRLLHAMRSLVKSGRFLLEFIDLVKASEIASVQKLDIFSRSKAARHDATLRFLFVVKSPNSLTVTHLIPDGFIEGSWSTGAREILLSLLENLDAQRPAILFFLCRACQQISWEQTDPSILCHVTQLLKACDQKRLCNLLHEAADLADAVMHKLDQDQQQALQEILESWLGIDPLLNSTIFDTLAAHRRIDALVTPQRALGEISNLLRQPRSRKTNLQAATFFENQFEEIFQDSYCEAVEILSDQDRLEFHVRAALGLRPESFFGCGLLVQLIASDAAATREAFNRWTKPPENSFIVSGDFGGKFLLAHFGFARLRTPVPITKVPESADTAAWIEWGKIIYWVNRSDLEATEKIVNCQTAWSNLRGSLLLAAIDPWFRFVEYTGRKLPERLTRLGYRSLDEIFPQNLKELLELGLSRTPELTSVLHPLIDRDAMVSMIFAYLGKLGDQRTLLILGEWVDSDTFGTEAIQAIRAIRDRLSA